MKVTSASLSFLFVTKSFFFYSSSFCLIRFLSDFKLNPNPIQLYVPYVSTSIKASFSFPLNTPDVHVILVCFMIMLYEFLQYIPPYTYV